ncbi:hypothetical protein GCK32_006565 [Trichostrongylus colubriformis]|uniref:Uncharacterized protein n=1 Tax=Trichostrongylus colubriformis TaxID=6319 RepID=A0AAN8FSG0_TRICO
MNSEWHEHSFFLEVKPRAELASLFVDCPPEYGKADGEAGDESDKENEGLNMVRVSEHAVELGTPPYLAASLHLQRKLPRYRANISNLTLYPQSLCASTWADNERLFMCKLHVEADGVPFAFFPQPLSNRRFNSMHNEKLGWHLLGKIRAIPPGT